MSDWIEVPLYEEKPFGIFQGSSLVRGKAVRIDRGHWDNRQQDWRAVITFDSGVVVQSGWWYSTARDRLAAAAA